MIRPRQGRRPWLHVAVLPLCVLFALTACDPSGSTEDPTASAPTSSSPSPSGSGSGMDRDPLADLEQSTWSVTDEDSLLALDLTVDDTVDLAAWKKDGVDDAVIDSVRGIVSGFVSTAYLDPEGLRGDNVAEAQKKIIAEAPTPWKDKLQDRFGSELRYFSSTQFAEPYRVVGSPQATMAWYLIDRGDAHRVELGGTIAYTVIDTRTLDVGVYAVRIGISAEAATGDEPISAAQQSITVHGFDVCKTRATDGLVVPAVSDSYDQKQAQKKTMESVVADPTVSEADIAREKGLQTDMSTVYDSGC